MERKMVRKAGILTLAFGILAAICVPVTISQASDGNYGYLFTIHAYKTNTRSDGRYRQTKDPENRWKVSMTQSNEPGGRTWTTYWLEGYDGSNVSGSVDVLENNGPYYQMPILLLLKEQYI